VAKTVFDEQMKEANQLHRLRQDVAVAASDLLRLPEGGVTSAGLELNIDVGIQYLEAWLRGNGAVAIYNLMEDAATAEISRAQLWQWAHHGARMGDGGQLTVDRVTDAIPSVLDRLRKSVGAASFDAGRFELAAGLFEEMTRSEHFPEFLTLRAYDHIE
jgi:malate synthase